jgi:acetylornithine deacetylase
MLVVECTAMNEATRLLKELVSIPSINPMGRDLKGPEVFEHRLTDYLEGFFKDLGVAYERQSVAALRSNIVARYQRSGTRRTLLLEAHQDTVPVDNMTIDPFGAQIGNGRLYGRGACDIKGGMASMLATFSRIVGDKPKGGMNVIMACTVDEEHTFLGVQRLVKSGIQADMAVVAEPTQMCIVDAHKGVMRWHVSTQGRSCHSSAPERGVNAIYAMAHVLSAIESHAKGLQAFRADPVLGPPTISVGRIEGGTSANTVPDRCRIEVDRRLIPGEDTAMVVRDFSRSIQELIPSGLTFECSDPWLRSPPLSSRGSDELVKRLGGAIDSVKGSHNVMAVPYGTDAAAIAEAGIPAVVFGPGDIAQAHTADEWVSLQEVEEASEVLYRLAVEV